MGSNVAECHPVAFRWVMQAKTRDKDPCTLIHVDPRFTRTSAMANIYAPLRAGSDIVFLGALINYVLEQHVPIFNKEASALSERCAHVVKNTEIVQEVQSLKESVTQAPRQSRSMRV